MSDAGGDKHGGGGGREGDEDNGVRASGRRVGMRDVCVVEAGWLG